MPKPSWTMPLRTLLASFVLSAIAVTGFVMLLLTGLPVSQELSLMSVLLIAAVPMSLGFASLALAPLEKERLRMQTAARNDLQASVRRFGEALRLTTVDRDGEPNLAPLLGVVLETALSAVDGRRGVIYRADRPHSRLDPVAVIQVENPQMLAFDEGVAGWIASHRANLRVPIGGQPYLAAGEPDEPVAIGVPLETSDDLFGVLVVYGHKANRAFNEDDLAMLSSLGNQAAIGAENVLLHHEAQRLSVTDALTGLANYRAFRDRLAIEFERAVRFGRPLSLAIVDIDHFKQINDQFGHQRGDAVLADLAARMSASTRTSIDLVARYGGEEFAVLLPETDAEGAAAVSEKIRVAAAQTPFAGGEQHLHATVSVGFAAFPAHASDPGQLVAAADLALYEAKRDGRNRVGSPTKFPTIRNPAYREPAVEPPLPED